MISYSYPINIKIELYIPLKSFNPIHRNQKLFGKASPKTVRNITQDAVIPMAKNTC